MAARGQLWAWLGVAMIWSACGARPGMDPLSDASSPGPDAVMPDAMVQPDAEVLPTNCTWLAGGRRQVTEPPNDKAAHSMVVTESGVLIGWRTTNPDPPADNTHYVQRVTFSGAPDGDKVAVFPPPSGWSTSYMSLATGHGRVGAVTWDSSAGCRFRSLDALGNTTGDVRTLGPDRCAWLRATDSGFTGFSVGEYSASEWRLFNLDAQGTQTHTSEIIEAISGGAFWWSSTRLPDGSFVVAGMDSDLDPTVIRSQRIDANGNPLNEPTTIASLPTPSNGVSLLALNDLILAGWFASDTDDDSTQDRFLTFQRLDLEGRPLGAPWRASERVAYRDAGWSWTRLGGQLLVVIVEPLDGDPYGDATAVTLLPFTLQGDPNGDPVELTQLRFARRPKVRSTPHGVVTSFTGIADEPTPHQIFTVPATCEVINATMLTPVSY
ncbi:MAG: hypothetical protein ABI333_19250 [bacterium]